jgi:hypothetical protein
MYDIGQGDTRHNPDCSSDALGGRVDPHWKLAGDTGLRCARVYRGATAEQIRDDFPTLSLREICGAISYYLDHEDKVEGYLRRRDQEAARVRPATEVQYRSDALRRRIRERYMQAPKGPHVSSRRF